MLSVETSPCHHMVHGGESYGCLSTPHLPCPSLCMEQIAHPWGPLAESNWTKIVSKGTLEIPHSLLGSTQVPPLRQRQGRSPSVGEEGHLQLGARPLHWWSICEAQAQFRVASQSCGTAVQLNVFAMALGGLWRHWLAACHALSARNSDLSPQGAWFGTQEAPGLTPMF